MGASWKDAFWQETSSHHCSILLALVCKSCIPQHRHQHQHRLAWHAYILTSKVHYFLARILTRTGHWHQHRHPREDPCNPLKDVGVSGELARMSVSVSALWKSGLTNTMHDLMVCLQISAFILQMWQVVQSKSGWLQL